ncbi:MAG: hypothetical protein AAB853_05150, partial [Patescibacteria group bacterium]
MSEAGGFEIFTPGEGAKGAPESLSEEAKRRFAAAAAAMQQLRREEKQARKKDDQVARTIIQFLQDPAHTHFFVLISQLVARNCPSIFILGILSLIHADCLKAVEEYFGEHAERGAHETVEETLSLVEGTALRDGTNRQLIDWITRLQMILAHDAERILESLLLPAEEGKGSHLDGSILQLTVFTLQRFFLLEEKKDLPYDALQPLT